MLGFAINIPHLANQGKHWCLLNRVRIFVFPVVSPVAGLVAPITHLADQGKHFLLPFVSQMLGFATRTTHWDYRGKHFLFTLCV